ncbi:hypothetical protein [Streptosporangium sp. NPDC051022]|uniref:hypothetical protein n=1 Tax=Streptosporangium sp. NPDC051022 TaxID=3155752 RepID=UPI003445DA27
MKEKVSIVVMVDAVGALSERTLHNGNLSLIDDSTAGSQHQGTPDLITAVVPGQVVHWTPIHIDVQTPVEIHSIEFLSGVAVPPPADPADVPPADDQAAVPPYPVDPSAVPAFGAVPATGADATDSNGHENHDLLVWEGVVPYDMTPGVPYRYRLSLKLHDGANSVLHIDSPALLRV